MFIINKTWVIGTSPNRLGYYSVLASQPIAIHPLLEAKSTYCMLGGILQPLHHHHHHHIDPAVGP